MPYNVRDILGHFIRPETREGAKCPHPCCNGKRPHPDNLPVMLSKSSVRSLTDAQLVQHMERDDVQRRPHALGRVVREEQRREQAAARRVEAKTKRTAAQRGKRRAAQESYRLWLESEWVAAESATRGNLVNRRGRVKGIDGRTLWNATPATRGAYASDELKSYWDRHPVMTAAEFAAYERRDEHAVNQHNRARANRQMYGVY